MSPYDVPVWNPLGGIIGFNHTPVKKVDVYKNNKDGCNCPPYVVYTFNSDSTGFWLINTDGSNMHRALPYMLNSPSWSPDGKQIAFSNGGQLCVMPFDGSKFDTQAIRALPVPGENYDPAWSSDGKKIAYAQNVCNDSVTCGIWVYSFETNHSENVGIYGGFPCWQLTTDFLIYVTSEYNSKGASNGNNIWIYNQDTTRLLKSLLSPNIDNRYFKYSPDGKTIGFVSALNTGEGEQLYKMNSDGTGLTKLTSDGCIQFSWSPEGKIVYVNFNSDGINKTKGTLWIMDANGNNKKQLTYNIF
jgi:Tol biopolymer transport system component